MQKNKIIAFLFLSFFLISFASALELNPFAEKKIYEPILKEDMSDFLKEDFNSDYGVIKLSKTFLWIEGDKIAEYSLIDNTAQCLINCEARGKATLYNDGQLFEDLNFIGKKGTSKDINGKYLIKEKETYYVDVPDTFKEVCVDVGSNLTKDGETSQNCYNETATYKKEARTREVWNEYKGEVLTAGDYEWKVIANKKPLESVDFIPRAYGKEFNEWAWWNSDWRYRKEITLKDVSGNIVNFTKYIEITYDENMEENWNDIRFVTSDGTTELPYDFDFKNSTTAGVWIKIYSLSTGDNNIYIYYGNSEASAGNSSALTFADARNFLMFNNGVTSFGSADTFAINGGLKYESSSIMNSTAQNSTGIYDYATSSQALEVIGSEQWSMTTIINPQNQVQGAFMGFAVSQTGTWGIGGCYISNSMCGAGLRVCCGDETSGSWSGWQSCGTINSNEWSVVSYKHNATKSYCYVNGNSGTNFGGNSGNVNNNFRVLGRESIGSQQNFGGLMTTAVFYHDTYIGQDDNFIKTLSQNINSSSYVLGAEESLEGVSVALSSPANAFETNSQTIFFNATITPTSANLTNVTWRAGNQEDFQTYNTNENLTLNWTKTLDDGEYSWNVTACWIGESETEDCTESATRTFEIESIDPSVSIDYPTGNLGLRTIGDSIDLNYSATDTNLDSCWYNYNGTNVSLSSCGNSTFTLEDYGVSQSLTLYANDTFGNLATETGTFEFDIIFNNVTYDNSTAEGELETFNLIAQISGGSSLTNTKFIYDGIEYTTNVGFSGGFYNISSTINIPLVSENSNKSFYFNLTVDGTEYMSEMYNIIVEDLKFGVCGGTNTDVLMNLNLYTERERNTLVGDIEISGELIVKTSGTVVDSFSTEYLNISTAQVCFTPTSYYNSYYLDADIRYVSDGFVPEFYTIQKADLGEYPKNISLYDLNSSYSTEFLIKYQGDNLIPVEGAIVQLLRKYISNDTYEIVEAPVTSNIGTTVVHIDLDTNLYQAIVVKEGVILDTFTNVVFNCENELSGICTQNLFGSIDPQNVVDIETLLDFSYVISEVNNTITTIYSIPSGSPSTINIVMYQEDMFGNSSLCNQSIYSSGGSVDCDYEESIGDSVISLKIFKDGVLIAEKGYLIKESLSTGWLGNNFFIVFILLISLVGMAVSSPEWIIVNAILTFVVAGGVFLVNGVDFVVGLGGLLWLMIAGAIIITKMTTQEDR